PSFSTRAVTSRICSDEPSNRHSSASNPLVLGFAFREARLRLAAGFGGMIAVYYRRLTESSCAILPHMFLSFAPLRKHRDYRLLYTGQLVSMFGSMMTNVAVPVQVYELTHSSFAVGMLGAAQLVPLLVFALLGGSYADAMDRRRLLIVSEFIMTLGSLVLVINGTFAHPSVVLIFLVSAAMAATNGFHRPALDAMTPQLVDREDLTAVSALNFFRFSISAIGGPAFAGFCMATFGYAVTYTIDVLSFGVSLAALAAIRKMPASDQAR